MINKENMEAFDKYSNSIRLDSITADKLLTAYHFFLWMHEKHRKQLGELVEEMRKDIE